MPDILFLHPGARAHYLLPRALANTGRLKMIITDIWIPPRRRAFLSRLLPNSIIHKLKGRYHEDLELIHVQDLGWKGLWNEFQLRKKFPKYGWDQIIARDKYVKTKTKQLIYSGIQKDDILIGFAYTSLEAFEIAKKVGARTILYQMDPAKAEEDYIAQVIHKQGADTEWERAPISYWKEWKQECVLADTILVNSEWSKKGLMEEGVPADKIKIFPLPIEISSTHRQFIRTYPQTFTKERPLRLLFLGTLMVRKGIHVLLQTAQRLQGSPIEFILVGRTEIKYEDFSHLSNIRYEGEVLRSQVDIYYQEADVFLFPTLSDGFGLTQLEAMAWKLPVINTTNCAQVVTEESGWTITPDSVDELVRTIQTILTHPEQLNMKSTFAFRQADLHNIHTFANSFVGLL